MDKMIKMRYTSSYKPAGQRVYIRDFEVSEDVAQKIESTQNEAPHKSSAIYAFNGMVERISDDEGLYHRMVVIAGQKEYKRL